MSDLLLELFSEEIPARMQAQASADLKKLVTDALVERGLTYEAATSFATPRRLALNIVGLPTRQPDQREEKKGPRVGAPEAAAQGFLKSAGLASLDQAKIETDKKGGQFYVAVIERKGAATLDVLAEILPAIIKTFPWPKAMRWGAASAEPSALRWVRPLHSVVASFGPETEDPDIVPFEVGGIQAGNTTFGHRFMAPQPIKVRRFDDYLPALEKAKVVLDPARRRDIILHDCKDLAFAQGLELVEDEGLLQEVAGLVEWPVVLMGEFDASFLDIPGEVIRATIRANQKCFVLRDPATGKLANKFLLVSNILASDGGKAIAAGNGRVVRARLSDALYFWKTDQGALPDYADKGKPLDQRLAKLRALNIVFHQKLGTQGERVDRIVALARELASKVGADPDAVSRAAELAKADLVTEVVGEFPETQGSDGPPLCRIAGRRCGGGRGDRGSLQAAGSRRPRSRRPGLHRRRARRQTRHAGRLLGDRREADGQQGPLRVAPRGPGRDPDHPGEQHPPAPAKCRRQPDRQDLQREPKARDARPARPDTLGATTAGHISKQTEDRFVTEAMIARNDASHGHAEDLLAKAQDLLGFFADRLKIYLRDRGARHDLLDAVFALGEDDLVMIVARIAALEKFLGDRGRRKPARRLQARRQHPQGRGKEGRRRSIREAPGSQSAHRTAGTRAGGGARPRPERGRREAEGRGFRRRLACPGETARARGRLLRRSDRQCGQRRSAPKPPAIAGAIAPRHASGR